MSRFLSSKKLKKLLLVLVILILVVSTPALFLQKGLNVNNIKLFVSSFGILAPLIFIIITTSTNVIPPLAATPFWIAGVVLFGPILGFLYSYLANVLGSTINYYIAKIWGRPAVAKVAGQSALNQIDKLPNIDHAKTVFLLKLVGGAATDYISYGSGLSKVTIAHYLLGTAFAITPMMLVGFLIISKISFSSALSAASGLGLFYLVNYLTTLLLIPVSVYIVKIAPAVKPVK
jgi:uncharacterized membrane protein YdjX (TVP38/TMEM64 family)